MDHRQYQISYFSPDGRVLPLVRAFYQMLPENTLVSNLEEEEKPAGDIQLVGFDYARTNLKAIPIQVMEYRDKLEGKVIFLFATVPFQPNDTVEGQIHRHTVAFLPRECDFRGIYLCSAQPSDALLRNMEEIVSQHPENSRAKHWLERFMCAAGHPDSADIQQGCRFMKHVLELA